MNYLDRDIDKLYKYAQDLGLKVYTRPYNKFSGEAEYIYGESITLFPNSRTTKTETILSLLHELGHHLDWLENGFNKKENDTLIMLNRGKMEGKRDDLTKEHRRIILRIERNGVKWMSRIHKKLKLELPFFKVKHQQELDLFQYQYLYRYGRFATNEEATKIFKKVKWYKRKYGR